MIVHVISICMTPVACNKDVAVAALLCKVQQCKSRAGYHTAVSGFFDLAAFDVQPPTLHQILV